jgi:uncharacterized protein (TIGR02231 family)
MNGLVRDGRFLETVLAFGLLLALALALAVGCASTSSPAPPAAAEGAAPGPAAAPGAPSAAASAAAPPAALVVPAAPTAGEPQGVPLASAVRRVTVYSDRALVTREATARTSAEATVYAFAHLPGWVDDGSVRVSTSAGRILDVRVERSFLAAAHDEAYRKAEAEVRALEGQLGELDDELVVLAAQAQQVGAIQAFSLDKLHKDVVVRDVGVGTYGSVLEFISKSLRDTARARRTVGVQRAALAPQLDAARRQVADLEGLRHLEETTVYVTLQGTGGPGESRLSLSYLLPGATWEAVHDVRVAEPAAGTVEVTSFAVVTQVSGEDWDGAELTFSTQSSSSAVRIPELEALTLGGPQAATHILERRSASFSRAEAAFEGQNRLWNEQVQKRAVGHAVEQQYQTNFEYLRTVQSKTVQLFQSLQQRGTTAQFRALSPASVRADGRTVRVPIGRADLAATQAIVAAPEQSLNAARTLQMRNDGGQPLLPGNVALYQGGAFLGMTSLEFVAAGEQFSLFLSVADQLKLSRTLDRKRSAIVRKERTQMQLAFLVKAENLSAEPISLVLADRVPVSEERDIVVSAVKVTPDARPDSKGIVRWELTLAPGEARDFEVRYQLEYPPTLVLDLRRERAPYPSAAPPAPGMRAPAKARDLREDIEVMEGLL